MELSNREVEILCEAGGLAPSGGNAQPWLVEIRQNILSIKLNSSLLSTAPHTYLLGGIFSLGMLAENICVASETLGLAYTLNFLNPTEPNQPFAAFQYTHRDENAPKTELSSLFHFLDSRLTNRKRHNGSNISVEAIDALQESIDQSYTDCSLNVSSDKNHREKVVDILAEAEAARLRNDSLFYAMLEEIRWNAIEAEQSKDGIDIQTLELSKQDLLSLRLLSKYHFLRKILPVPALKTMTKKYMLSASHIGCIAIHREVNHKNLFMAGRASQRLWLSATKLDLALHPWTSLPFMAFEVMEGGNSFNKKEKAHIIHLYKNLCSEFSLENDFFPVFVFRLFKASTPTVRAIRQPWKNYTSCIS